MLWTDIDHSFCESSITGLPEYYNAFSSLFISLFGIYGMTNSCNDLFIDIMYAKLIIIGFGYHWYGNIGWGLFDEMPMILAIFIGIVYTDNVHFLICKNENKNNSLEIRKYIYNKKTKLVLYLFTMCLILILNVMTNYRRLFPFAFAGVVCFLYYKISKLLNITSPAIKNIIFEKARNSLLTVAASGSIWAITEVTCNYIKSKFFLLGHPMWHFFIGHGFYNLIQIVYFIKINDANYTLNFNRIYLIYICPANLDSSVSYNKLS